MSIPTQAQAKTAVIAAEIAPFEKDITAYLQTPAMITYLEGATVGKTVVRTFLDKELSEAGILALMESIEAAGWVDVVVDNQFTAAEVGLGISRGPQKKEVLVSFKPAPVIP
jgi:hypothetical protein